MADSPRKSRRLPASSADRRRSRRLAVLVVAAWVACAAGALARPGAASPITIGPGPARGTDRAGVTWYEEFQDWRHSDLRALDDVGPGDIYVFGDGFDDSRDLVAFYYREEGAHLYFRVDLHDLKLGAEVANLDLYVAIDAVPGVGQAWLPDYLDCTTDHPWELCVAVYESGTNQGTDYRVYDRNFNLVNNAYLGSYFSSQLDAVEFGIERQALLDAGWNGTSPLVFQVFTAKDGAETSCSGGGLSSDLADAIVDDDRGCSDGVLNGGIAAADTAGVVYYASIAHGNQSVNRASAIGAHIYDPPANTGIAGGTGFLRTLDTHQIFGVPLNIHPSGTLTIACNWARRPLGAADPQDGPTFLACIAQFADADQAATPGSLIGGVFAEHIMPYFEGPVNASALALAESINAAVYGVGAAQARVMHVPERVIRSQPTGMTPLDGRTFEDIAASPYAATYLDEVTHLHAWFYPGESCSPDQGYRHKIHRIEGVYCFMINDREDQAKFANWDGGMPMDTRQSLLQEALYGGSSEIVVVFDDWEALAGKSFDPVGGAIVPNNNPNQYHNTIRWAANHPWIAISNLKDLLALGLANPGAFVVDHGRRDDLPMQTYEWLKHAAENAYDFWYYDRSGGQGGNEQSFYDLVPVITGPQGDYHARGATPVQDGPPLPSGRRHGDLDTPGSLLYETWKALQDAPAGRLRQLGIDSYLAMIYETAWHEEDQVDYSDSDCFGSWLHPDTSWDGLNTWALRLQNHVRQAGLYAAGAVWADEVRRGVQGSATQAQAVDLDQDGEAEYVLRNDRVYLVFEKYGGRCVLAAAYDPTGRDAEVIVGAPFTNPSAPGEEEFTGPSASRCSAFKDMNGGAYADVPYAAAAIAGGWRFTSPDARIVKSITAAAGSAQVDAAYQETVAGPLYVRLGLAPNPLDLALHGQSHLVGQLRSAENAYILANTSGGGARVGLGGTTFDPSPADAGPDRRDLGLTEEVELSGEGDFGFSLTLVPGMPAVSDLPGDTSRPRLALRGPYPSPSAGGAAQIFLELAHRTRVRYEIVDVAGRRVLGRDLGWCAAGDLPLQLESRAASGAPLPAGVYFVRVEAGSARATRRWVLLGRQ